MRNWTVVPQIEYVDGAPVEMLCKHLTTYPVTDVATGETLFRLLPRGLFILRVIVEADDEKHELKIIENGKNVKYVWQQPSRLTRPTIKIGLGKGGRRYVDSRREVVDMLSPFHRVAGDKAEYASKSDFIAHLDRVLGRELASDVMELFRWRRPLCVTAARTA